MVIGSILVQELHTISIYRNIYLQSPISATYHPLYSLSPVIVVQTGAVTRRVQGVSFGFNLRVEDAAVQVDLFRYSSTRGGHTTRLRLR